jgi:hypothetical protein
MLNVSIQFPPAGVVDMGGTGPDLRYARSLGSTKCRGRVRDVKMKNEVGGTGRTASPNAGKRMPYREAGLRRLRRKKNVVVVCEI